MADSGSFDSGDVAALADLDALLALVDATCATAGVAGSGLSAGHFTANRVVNSASTWQAVVAAYQRAWDASANKPGTRQASPSAGSDFAGALFQNMWTQLSTMTFDKWINWDMSSEAGLASDNEFVVLAENTVAGGTETGQGGGLTGANLVLTPSYSVAGITGTPPTRYLDGTNTGRFDWPQAALETFLKSTAAWSCMWATGDRPSPGYTFVDLCDGGSNQLDLIVTPAGYAQLYLQMNSTYIFNGVDIGTELLPTGNPLYFGVWKDSTTIRAGWSTSRFTKWSDLLSTRRISASTTAQFTALGSSRRAVFGSPGPSQYPVVKCWWFVASKRCLIDNNS